MTKLVPKLKEVESCIDVPKEVCIRSERNPRKVKYPVIRHWCYSYQCPQKCIVAAKNGQCLPECSHYKDIKCCALAQLKQGCPKKCSEAATWGECPNECKKYSPDPLCCAPKCPAKCTNKRQGECSIRGVSECSNVPGCCPEKYELLFGDVNIEVPVDAHAKV